MTREHPPAEAFFLDAAPGTRFCLYHAPHADRRPAGAFLYVHPFGDEMNKSRRMAALQARAFAAMGFGVLQIDLFGCGDSSGEFADARWDIWKHDLAVAREWLEERTSGPIGLWSLRLGALLALDFAGDPESAIGRIVLWQPVISGASFLTQFLRMRLAGEMLAGDAEKPAGTQAMRDALAAGETLEVAGYELAPDLAAAIDRLSAADLATTKCPVHWFEIVPEAGRSMPPAAARTADAWVRGGADLRVRTVPGPQFWATQEISECPGLVAATVEPFCEAAP
ncbi:MAG: hydrolase 2, exosortase A system-associated [Sulfuricella sp.]|nr:hydrolase 2, exosortase A system-associated [Sulfuricella sp.]